MAEMKVTDIRKLTDPCNATEFTVTHPHGTCVAVLAGDRAERPDLAFARFGFADGNWFVYTLADQEFLYPARALEAAYNVVTEYVALFGVPDLEHMPAPLSLPRGANLAKVATSPKALKQQLDSTPIPTHTHAH